eukprot:XP_003728098.1 PREDICTED: uncharacterized protein LOC100892548 [Strongylocentrotus purpuratus]
MDQLNDTFPQEITQTPPENPMYAGGIAVLVAFVLFMYWGSLHEKDDTEDDKKKKPKKQVPNWLQKTVIHGKRKKKRTNKRKGVYSVSDAMSKHLLADTGQEQTTCAECEKCRIHEHDMQIKTTSSTSDGAQLSSKTTSNKTARSASCNRAARPLLNIRGKENAPVGQPRSERANSSPEITVATPKPKNTACTCARPRQNGGNAAHPPKRQCVAPSDRDDEGILVKCCERNCERTSELTTEDCLHFEKETRNNLLDLDKPCLKSKVPCSGGVTANGKVLRQLDDASVRLESHPNVAITIFAESVI